MFRHHLLLRIALNTQTGLGLVHIGAVLRERPTHMANPTGGWYEDPDDHQLQRYWDGTQWTSDRRRMADPTAASPATETLANSRANRGLASMRRLADAATHSAVAHKVADAATSAGHTIADTAKDPVQMKRVMGAVAPTFDAALDGAGVRNKKGKVKIWRVARAATRPRKSVTRMGAAVLSTTGGQLDSALARRAAGAPTGVSDRDILNQWTLDDAGVALSRWREGMARFDQLDETAADGEADVERLRDVARLLCVGLKHCLLGEPTLDDDQVVETTGDVLALVLEPSDAEDWTSEDQQMLRLALGVARRWGVQPEALEGNGELDHHFQDPYHRMRMAMAVATGPWSCDLAAWFKEASHVDS